MNQTNTSHTASAKKTRSNSYPALSLEKSISSVRMIKDNLGVGPFDRLSAAKALNYSSMSGTASQAVAALVHFGLLDRKGDVYRLSVLAEDVLTYRDDSERMSAIVRAVQHPKLYSELLARFGGRSLPAMLDNILVRDHGINERVAGEVKKVFVESTSFAGFLENGVLRSPDVNAPLTEPSPAKDDAMVAREQSKLQSQTYQRLSSENVIPVTKGFSIDYPAEVALLDLMINQKFVNAVAALKTAIDELPDAKTVARMEA